MATTPVLLDNAGMPAASFGDPRNALIVEDDTFTRALLTSLIESIGYDVTATGSGADAIAALSDSDPDVAVVDLDLGPGPTGLDVAHALVAACPWAAVVLMSSHHSIELVHPNPLIPTANFQFVTKGMIRSTADISDAITAAVTNQPTNRTAEGLIQLLPAQADLLRLIASGLSNEEIAERESVGVKAVERRIARLYRTLSVPSSTGTNPRVEATLMYNKAQVIVR